MEFHIKVLVPNLVKVHRGLWPLICSWWSPYLFISN